MVERVVRELPDPKGCRILIIGHWFCKRGKTSYLRLVFRPKCHDLTAYSYPFLSFLARHVWNRLSAAS